MKNVLVLGASGLVAPYVTPGLEADYRLRLTDVKPHPDGKPITTLDVTSYEQVLAASRGMDAIINFTVVREDPVQSFEVNVKGAYFVMKAAVENGIKKVIQTGCQVIRNTYEHDFDLDEPPLAAGTGHYMFTKYLSYEVCKIYAREYGIQTICFLFAGLGPKPEAPVKADFGPFWIIWEDLQHAMRLALEIESVPDNFQLFHMLSYLGHGKYTTEKARRVLGFRPVERWEEYHKRVP